MVQHIFGYLPAFMLAVGMFGCDQPTSPLLPGGIGSPSPTPHTETNIRNDLLGKLQGKTLQQKRETLLNIIKTDNSELNRRDALQYLVGLGHDAWPIAEPLAEQFLIEPNPRIALAIKQTLIGIQADVESLLVGAGDGADQQQRLRIIELLGEASAPKPETIAYLVTQLESSQQIVVVASCEALAKIGTAGDLALPKLIVLAAKPRVPLEGSTDRGKAFRDSRNLQNAAVRAIAAVGADESAIDVLTLALSREPQIAEHAAKALAQLGRKAMSALPELNKLRSRDDHGGKDVKTRLARNAAADAIQAIKHGN